MPTLSSEIGISQRHTGVAGTGYRIAPTGPAGTDFFNFILVSTDTGYVRVEGVEIDGSGLTAGENVRGLMANDSATSQDVRFAHNLIHDITNTTIDDTDNSRVFGIFLDSTDNSKVANNIIYNLTSVSTYSQGQARGIEGDDPGKTHHVYNNTLYNIRATATAGSATGILDTGGNTVFARNNYGGLVDSALGGEACFSGSFAAENNNVASDATAVGAGSQINQSAYASYFVNVTPGSEDLHLLDDSNALWGTSGADLDSDPNLPVTEDIDREPRHPSTPDIGADEVSVSVNYRSIGSYSTGDASITAATTTVLFAGSASLPTDVQPGDQLTINPGGGNEETLTIASRDSATQVTVSGPAASTHTNEPYLLFWQYTIGDATVALGSSTVTFGGGASLPAKTGLGDRLVIGGETFHVLTRDSVTQVTVDNGAVSAHTAAGYTLKRAYQTLQGWEDDRDGDLVAEQRREVGVTYIDGPFDPPYASSNSALLINGSTTDVDHFMWLTVASGQRHNGTAGTGVVVDGRGITKFGMNDQDDFTRIDSLELARFKKASDSGFASIVTTGVNAIYSHLLVHDFLEPTANGDGIRVSATAGGWSFTLRNSILYHGDRSGVRIDEATSNVTVENVTIHDMDTFGLSIGGGGGTATVTNTISTDSGTASFEAGSGTLTQSYNLSSDATATGTGSLTTRPSANQFVSTTLGSEDLHLKAGADALDTAFDLSGSFCCDIDGGNRVAPWDIGADDLAAATAVSLVAFEAQALDGVVELRWETGSEIDNLGFHLYRSAAENREYERITTTLIPGLGSSPEGATYVYRDSGLSNGTVYFYKLEDIETTERTELHGPVSATPRAGSGSSEEEGPGGEESGRNRITFGNPSANRFEVLSWSRRGAVVELRTEGFYAEPLEDGSVLLEIPDFERISNAAEPAIPVRRPWIDAVAGVDVTLVSVEELDRHRFTSLSPSGAETYEAISSRRGVVRPARRVRRPALDRQGLFPATAARPRDRLPRGREEGPARARSAAMGRRAGRASVVPTARRSTRLHRQSRERDCKHAGPWSEASAPSKGGTCVGARPVSDHHRRPSCASLRAALRFQPTGVRDGSVALEPARRNGSVPRRARTHSFRTRLVPLLPESRPGDQSLRARAGLRARTEPSRSKNGTHAGEPLGSARRGLLENTAARDQPVLSGGHARGVGPLVLGRSPVLHHE